MINEKKKWIIEIYHHFLIGLRCLFRKEIIEKYIECIVNTTVTTDGNLPNQNEKKKSYNQLNKRFDEFTVYIALCDRDLASKTDATLKIPTREVIELNSDFQRLLHLENRISNLGNTTMIPEFKELFKKLDKSGYITEKNKEEFKNVLNTARFDQYWNHTLI